MPVIVIPDDYQGATRNLQALSPIPGYELVSIGDLHRDPLADEWLSRADAVILIRERTQVDRAFLERTPRLKLISQTGKIARHVDLTLCRERGVDVVEGSGSPIAPAELTWILIMNAMRQFVPAAEGMKAGQWQTGMGDTLAGKHLGLLGFGKIAKRVARFAQAFDMTVQVWGSQRGRDEAQAEGWRVPDSREEFFATSDVLSLHQRLVPETEGQVTAADLAQMSAQSILVNTARAELIAPGALLKALALGRPGFAALDVYDEEPVYDSNHPLLAHANVLCSPHLGYVARSGYELYFRIAMENVVRYFSGDKKHVL